MHLSLRNNATFVSLGRPFPTVANITSPAVWKTKRDWFPKHPGSFNTFKYSTISNGDHRFFSLFFFFNSILEFNLFCFHWDNKNIEQGPCSPGWPRTHYVAQCALEIYWLGRQCIPLSWPAEHSWLTLESSLLWFLTNSCFIFIPSKLKLINVPKEISAQPMRNLSTLDGFWRHNDPKWSQHQVLHGSGVLLCARLCCIVRPHCSLSSEYTAYPLCTAHAVPCTQCPSTCWFTQINLETITCYKL